MKSYVYVNLLIISGREFKAVLILNWYLPAENADYC